MAGYALQTPPRVAHASRMGQFPVPDPQFYPHMSSLVPGTQRTVECLPKSRLHFSPGVTARPVPPPPNYPRYILSGNVNPVSCTVKACTFYDKRHLNKPVVIIG